MNKKLAGWALSLLKVAGVVLVGAFFAPWTIEGITGWSIAWHGEHWLFLVPASGVLLAATAHARSEHTRLAAVAAGLLVAGVVMFQLLRGALNGGLELWLMLGGAAAVLAGMGERSKGTRVLGALAILAGFFAPWTSASLFRALLSDGVDLARELGIFVNILWLIPVAGVAALVSPGMSGTRGRYIAGASGVAVFGSMLWVIGSIANLVFAWGAWVTFAASATALVLGVLAPAEKAA
jgi:hypothetical protein